MKSSKGVEEYGLLAPDPIIPAAVSVARARHVPQGMLDVIPVTDNIYHHLAFTRPLVDSLVSEIRRAGPNGRVLVIGPNELLPHVLIELGYEVDLWVLDGLPLSEGIRRRASRFGPLDEMLRAPATDQVDVVVAPYVAEAADLEPSLLLRVLGTHLKPGGRIVLACRQPGEIRRQLRRILRRVKANVDSGATYPPSPTWPALASRRLLAVRDLTIAAESQFVIERAHMVIDHRACITTEALSLRKWLVKEALYVAKVVVPRFRDCALVTLVATSAAR